MLQLRLISDSIWTLFSRGLPNPLESPHHFQIQLLYEARFTLTLQFICQFRSVCMLKIEIGNMQTGQIGQTHSNFRVKMSFKNTLLLRMKMISPVELQE